MTIKEILKTAKMQLEEACEKLEDLEAEKKVIMDLYPKVNEKQKQKLEVKMQESIQKFNALYEEVLELSEKIKRLKAKI